MFSQVIVRPESTAVRARVRASAPSAATLAAKRTRRFSEQGDLPRDRPRSRSVTVEREVPLRPQSPARAVSGTSGETTRDGRMDIERGRLDRMGDRIHRGQPGALKSGEVGGAPRRAKGPWSLAERDRGGSRSAQRWTKGISHAATSAIALATARLRGEFTGSNTTQCHGSAGVGARIIPCGDDSPLAR